MSGYKRSRETVEESGLNDNNFVKKNQHEFFDKMNGSEVFYFVLPPVVDGYAPEAIAYHNLGASIEIPGLIDQKTGKNKQMVVRHFCLNRICAKCIKNRERYGKDTATPMQERKQTGQKIVIYPVAFNQSENRYVLYPSKAQREDTGLSPSKHQILEYWYRYDANARQMVSDDWENLLDQFDLLANQNIDPVDPTKAVVFEVRRERYEYETGKFTVRFRHKALPQYRVALPSDWEEKLKGYFTHREAYFDLTARDLEILVKTAEKIEALKAKPESEFGSAQAKEAAIAAVHKDYHSISNIDFKRVLEGLERKAAEARLKGSQPVRQETGYTRGSGGVVSTPVTVETEDDGYGEEETQTSSTPFESDSVSSSQSKLDAYRARLKEMNNKNNQ